MRIYIYESSFIFRIQKKKIALTTQSFQEILKILSTQPRFCFCNKEQHEPWVKALNLAEHL